MGRGGSRKIGQVRGLERQFQDVLSLIEKSLSEVDGTSQLEGLTSAARKASLDADPLLAALYGTTQAGLDDGGYGGLPQDFAETLQTDVRASQASRGILDSDVSAIEEAVRMMGGRESIRNQRIAQAQSLLTSGLIPTGRDFLPTAGDLLGASMGVEQLRLQRRLGKKAAGSQALAAQGSWLSGLGSAAQGIGQGFGAAYGPFA